MSTITVRIPGTTANCGPGFDSIGMACSIYNYLTVEPMDGNKIVIEVEGEGRGLIPGPAHNIVVKAMQRVFEKTKFEPGGMKLKMKNSIPLARGLGSSAAAIVGGLVAANALAGSKLTTQELLELATEMEGHPDNVAPALLGGITVSFMAEGKAKSLRFLPAKPLTMVVAVPNFQLATKTARQVLPQTVEYGDALFNVSRAALLVGSLCTGNYENLSFALEDKLHQPYRKSLIPGFDAVVAAAQDAGALGAVLSGAGPCMIAFTQENAQKIGEAMVDAFRQEKIAACYHVLELDLQGAAIL